VKSIREKQEEERQRQDAIKQQRQEQSDYKRMYEGVLAENAKLLARLNEIEAKFGEALASVEDLHGKFSALEIQMKERSAEMLKMSESMQDMVASGYKQQTDLMERFRADISQRLTTAKEPPAQLGKNNG
jgi:predicted nuclease with TOPRIM domain